MESSKKQTSQQVSLFSKKDTPRLSDEKFKLTEVELLGLKNLKMTNEGLKKKIVTLQHKQSEIETNVNELEYCNDPELWDLLDDYLMKNKLKCEFVDCEVNRLEKRLNILFFKCDKLNQIEKIFDSIPGSVIKKIEKEDDFNAINTIQVSFSLYHRELFIILLKKDENTLASNTLSTKKMVKS